MPRSRATSRFFLIIALAALVDAVATNLPGLISHYTPTGLVKGYVRGDWHDVQVTLTAVTVIAGVGALVAYLARAPKQEVLRTEGWLLALTGFALYGAYQVTYAWLRLDGNERLPLSFIGLLYLLIGIACYLVGRRRR